MLKKTVIVCLLFLMFLILSFVDKSSSESQVVFFDVGQGDSILIKTTEKKMIIDGGPDNMAANSLGKYMDYWDRRIDYLLLTHPHRDHLTVFPELLKRYSIGQVIVTGVGSQDPYYLEFKKMLRRTQTKVMLADSLEKIDLAEKIIFRILYPQKKLPLLLTGNLNNSSIVGKLESLGKSILFTGDAEKEVEDLLENSDIDLHSKILKAGHHGSCTSSTEKFLETVRPKLVVVSVGKDNKYGHPCFRFLNNLSKREVPVLRTDKVGDVVIGL